ncbi:MAG: NADH-quinone oxidoreductase subunit J family protein [Anaerolineae bacterium]
MFLFIVFALIAVVAALGVILSRKPVYSALFLLLNFATLAAIYIMLQAQFLAAVQIIVYAGAIVVLFLFVVMLIGGGELTDVRDPNMPPAARFTWPRITALVLAVLLLAGVGYGLITGQLHPPTGNAAAFGQGSVEAIAGALYTDYLLPFEMTSVLLLVGMIGAVVLARKEG